MVKTNTQKTDLFTCNNFTLKMLLHKNCPLGSKMPLLLSTAELEFVAPSVVLTQLFAEHAIKQIAGIISVKMKTTPFLSGRIFLACDPRSSCISKLERADTAM